MLRMTRLSLLAPIAAGWVLALPTCSAPLPTLAAAEMSAVTADDATRRAEEAFDLGRGTEAMAHSQEALAGYRASGDIERQASTLEKMGSIALLMGEAAKAADFFAESRELARRAGDKKIEARALRQLAEAVTKANDIPREVVIYRELLARAEASGSASDQAMAAGRLGRALLRNQNMEEAAPLLRRAATLFHTAGRRFEEATALLLLGEVFKKGENHSASADAFQRAAAAAREAGDSDRESEATIELGRALYALGAYDRGYSALDRALLLGRRRGDKDQQGRILLMQGNVRFFQSRPREAAAIWDEARAIAEEIGDRAMEGLALGNLALASSDMNEPRWAEHYHQQTVEAAREYGDRMMEARALGNLGAFRVQQDAYSDAIPSLERSRDLARAIGYRRGEAIALRNLGLAQLRLHQPETAEATLHEAIDVQEGLLKLAMSNDADAIALQDSQSAAYEFLQAALVAQGKHEAALEISERGRARALAELLASRGTVPVRTAAPNVGGIRATARMHNATLVEMSIIDADAALYIWVIDPQDKISFRRIGIGGGMPTREGLSAIICETLAAIGAPCAGQAPGRPYTASDRDFLLGQLHRMLIEPIADLLPSSPDVPVVLIPQGPLFLLPFVALRDGSGRTLLERHTLLVQPSVEAFGQMSRSKAAAPRRPVLVVGNPSLRPVRLLPAAEPTRWTPIPDTEVEAVSIATLLEGNPLVGAAASRNAVLSAMPSATVIHLATHGVGADVRGQGVPGALAFAEDRGNDGLLTATDILGLRLQADLVVLSACETGLGKLTSDGVVGLSRAFIAAGARSVVVSLWKIPDRSTAQVMIAFYKALGQAPGKAQALRQAMLEVREGNPDPRAWAGFVILGQNG